MSDFYYPCIHSGKKNNAQVFYSLFSGSIDVYINQHKLGETYLRLIVDYFLNCTDKIVSFI